MVLVSASGVSVLFVALHNARGHTRRDNSTVSIDAESICAWLETQKGFSRRPPDWQRLSVPSPAGWWLADSFFGGPIEAPTRPIPPAAHISCFVQHTSALEDCIDGTTTAHTTLLWTTPADGHINHRSTSTWEIGAMEDTSSCWRRAFKIWHEMDWSITIS